MISSLGVLLYLIAVSLAAPMDDPIRIDLPVYETPQASPSIQLARPLEEENHPVLKIDKDNSIAGNSFHDKINSLNYGGHIFSAPVAFEGAVLETEGLGSKTLSIKENIQSVAAGLFQPQPIVDTIKEEEKYGNSGDKFYSAGRSIVGGAVGVSNLVNSVLEVPGSILRKITRIATEKLNNLGGKLVGL